MLNRLLFFEKSKDRFQVVVGHPAEVIPGHRCTQRPGANFAHAQSLDERRLVVITDSRSGWGYVRRDHVALGLVKEKPSGEFHSGKRLTLLLRRMAISTGRHAHEISTARGV